MGNSQTWRKFRVRPRTVLLGAVFLYAVLSAVMRAIVPPPAAVAMAGMQYPATFLQFQHDDSWLDERGDRQLSQQVFDQVFSMIEQAQDFILLDMFLFNAWQGPVAETHRALASELTEALVAQKRRNPEMQLIVISDPINTVYGGLASVHFERLREAGIAVVLTDLVRLQDSNPTWSGFWRVFVRPFGNSPGQLLPNPFGDGRVSLRSYLALLNFKANHRKLLVSDVAGEQLRALVSSANPHDGSSAHRNVALSFGGPAVLDLLAGERALLAMSGAQAQVESVDAFLEARGQLAAVDAAALQDAPSGQAALLAQTDLVTPAAEPLVQVLSESRIHAAILATLSEASAGDAVDLAMFYLSERRIIEALQAAHARGAAVRVLLDVNQDAFGREKNGVPNRPVAAELAAAGIQLRWCATTGEQCHAKWLHVRRRIGDSGEHIFLLGSANFTRRNLLDLNLETNVLVRTPLASDVAQQMIDFFDNQWNNRDGRTYSQDYETFAQDSTWLKLQYRFMEMTGLSTF